MTLFHSNGAVPSDIAVDSADGILYESFGSFGIVGLSLSNPNRGAGGIIASNATNLTIGGGKLYWQDGSNIFYANASDLSNVTLLHSDGVAPSDIVVDIADGVLYQSFAGFYLGGISLANPNQGGGGFRFSNATNLALSGGKLYWQDEANIFDANASNLSNTTLLATDTMAPADIAVYSTPAASAVPEPAAWGLVLIGVSMLMGAGRRLGERLRAPESRRATFSELSTKPVE